MKNVLITGANGFIGSWLTKRLHKEGHKISILVRPKSDLGDLNQLNLDIRYGDVTDLDSVIAASRGQDALFHLAGVVAYKSSERALMEQVNVGGTQNVVKAVQECRIPKLIHLSSVVAIGASFHPNEILNETSSYNLEHLNLGYFETKRKAEILVKEACLRNSIQAVILNPSTVYGYGDAKKGSRSTQVKVAQGRFPFYPYGGVNIVAVEDVIDGILSAWSKGHNGHRYILSGENLLIKDLFIRLATLAGVKPPRIGLSLNVLRAFGYLGDHLNQFGIKSPISLENAWTSSLYHWFDSTKARRELGFNPRPGQHALEKSVAWMRDARVI